MSDWTDTRRAAREVVHATFADHEARYYPIPGSGAGVQVSVRVHNKILAQGNLSNEGFAQILDEVERVIFLRTDVDILNIKKGAELRLPDGRNYRLEVRRPARDDYTVDFEVVRQ